MDDIWTIERTPGANWLVESVHHLTGEENHGNHHVYIDAKGDDGADLRNTGLNIYYGWDGMRDDEATPLVPIDKPMGEFGCNVPIFTGAAMYVGMHGAPSDIVRGLRTDFGDDDGQDGNSWGHQSFHVVFRYQPTQAEPQPGTAAKGLAAPRSQKPPPKATAAQPNPEPMAQPEPTVALQWEYHPAQGTSLPHHTAKVSDGINAWIIEGAARSAFRNIAYLSTAAQKKLTPTSFFPTVDQAKAWLTEQAKIGWAT